MMYEATAPPPGEDLPPSYDVIISGGYKPPSGGGGADGYSRSSSGHAPSDGGWMHPVDASAPSDEVPETNPLEEFRSEIFDLRSVTETLFQDLSESHDKALQSMTDIHETYWKLGRELDARHRLLQEHMCNAYERLQMELKESVEERIGTLKLSAGPVRERLEKSRETLKNTHDVLNNGDETDLSAFKYYMKDNIDEMTRLLEPRNQHELLSNTEEWELSEIDPYRVERYMGTLKIPAVPEYVEPEPEVEPNAPPAEELTTTADGAVSVDVGVKYKLSHTINLNQQSNREGAAVHGSRFCPSFFTVLNGDLIVVCDHANQCMKVFNMSGEYVQEFPVLHPKAYRHAPSVAAGPDGQVAITDNENSLIHVYPRDWNQDLSQMSVTYNFEEYHHRFGTPNGITITLSGRIVLALTGSESGAIVIFHPHSQGDAERVIRQVEGTYLRKPYGVTADQHGYVYFTDKAHRAVFRIHEFKHVDVDSRKWTNPDLLTELENLCTVNRKLLVLNRQKEVVCIDTVTNEMSRIQMDNNVDLKCVTDVNYTSDGDICVSEYVTGVIKVLNPM